MQFLRGALRARSRAPFTSLPSAYYPSRQIFCDTATRATCTSLVSAEGPIVAVLADALTLNALSSTSVQ